MRIVGDYPVDGILRIGLSLTLRHGEFALTVKRR